MVGTTNFLEENCKRSKVVCCGQREISFTVIHSTIKCLLTEAKLRNHLGAKGKAQFLVFRDLNPNSNQKNQTQGRTTGILRLEKSIEESWVVISPNMIFHALSTGFGFAIWAWSKTSINSLIMSYDTYRLLASGAYALIARSQSWLTHIQGFHIVWWPGVLEFWIMLSKAFHEPITYSKQHESKKVDSKSCSIMAQCHGKMLFWRVRLWLVRNWRFFIWSPSWFARSRDHFGWKW